MAMNELPLGDSGATVSALCLGTMFFGTTVDERTAFAVLDRYYDAGGRFFDTANNYAVWVDEGEGGESEALLGRWMRERGNRDDIFLATKVGGWHDAGLGAAARARQPRGHLPGRKGRRLARRGAGRRGDRARHRGQPRTPGHRPRRPLLRP